MHKRNSSEEIEYLKLKLKNFNLIFLYYYPSKKLNGHNSNTYSLIC